MTDLVFKSVLVCNDIRREATGKYIAIGIYGPDIAIPDEQATISVSCLLQVEARKAGRYRLEFRCRESRHRNAIAAKGEFSTALKARNIQIPLNLGNVEIHAGTEIEFAAREQGKRWKHLSSLAVRGPREQAEIEAKVQAFERERAATPSRPF